MLFCATQLLSFVAGSLLIGFLHHLHVLGFRRDDDFGVIILGTMCFQGATWVLIPLFLRWHDRSWRDAFGIRGWNIVRSFAYAVIALVVVLPAALWLQGKAVELMEHFGWQPAVEEAVQLVTSVDSLPMKIYLGLFAVVMAPVAEEFIFRGVLYPFVKDLGFPRLAFFGTAALFALIHANAAAFVPLFVLALAFTWLYERTDSLLAPILAHSLFNSANLVILSLLK